ncbi:hypothetical protein CYMTET_36443 [Cymbomonas tetramitiformis]|uniref:PiggyBac transposable element-derived protein domain-containing protein n=1 Tax=Cymbomonas tetramitiformis TaxID=36881 RepID=A0AAE0CFW7_9CHLO|nr:hypothetical protein CYMTET_36443 [Cymbomonas tetramitiformis]
MAPSAQPIQAIGIIKRRVKTPGEVFGVRVRHKTYFGTITKRDRPRGDPPQECVTVRYDDGQTCWFPVQTASRWLLPEGSAEAATAESEDLSDTPDSGESEQSDSEAGPSEKAVPTRRQKDKESPAQKAVRLEAEKCKEEISQTISDSFVENRRVQPPVTAFKHAKSRELYHDPPNDYTPGLLKTFVTARPKSVEDGMIYVFDKLLPKSYWQELSRTSLKYSVDKKAGQDTNADKAPDDRHPQYKGKGKQRPWNPKWVSPNGLLLFHESILLMVLNKRSEAQDHFSLDYFLRSIVADQYTRDSWTQTFRYLCPYDVDEYEKQKDGTSEYLDNPYLKYDSIQTSLFDGIHSIMVPPKVGSCDEGGKPWQGKGGEGITVHYNPQKPNKRMSMCFMFAAFGIPFAWEFYTGQRSNKYNEEKFNTEEERAYGKTISRILRLFRRAYGSSKGQELYMDNLFTSLFLFYLLATLFQAVATRTHRNNKLLPELTWGGNYIRGEYRWATAKHDAANFVYMEYGDNKTSSSRLFALNIGFVVLIW